MENLKLFIADDQTLMRDGLQIVIDLEKDMEVIGTADNGKEAYEKIISLKPDIVLMDIQMPVMNGIECIKLVKQKCPEIIILILTTFNEEDYIVEGLANGANGFLLKGIDFENLIASIRNAAKGNLLIPAEVAVKLANRLHNIYANKLGGKIEQIRKHLEKNNIYLTDREISIIKLMLEGLSNRKIAEKIFISEGTVKNYSSEIYRKFNVKNRPELLDYINQIC
ncbi:MAG TPA: response regulator transcription factor [Bacillus bacterium]|nr:response regulator transcription factor [Bacillus sp. (in: firmicutes)]